NAGPVRLQAARRDGVDAHWNPAALAGQGERLGLLRHTCDRDWRMGLLVRLEVDVLADAREVLRHGELPTAAGVFARLSVAPQLEYGVDNLERNFPLHAGPRVD